MKRVLVTFLLSLIILASFPISISLAQLPQYPESEDVYIIESVSKSTIVSQNSDKELVLGDLSDLMVSKVALDSLQGKLSSSITITKEDLKSFNEDETGIFVEGQTLTYQDLLNILLLSSNDNAAKLIGINIGRKLSGNDETDNTEALNIFVEKLNSTCQDLKLSKTNFTDVIGDENKSTPVDLAIMVQDVLGNKTIQSILNSDSYEVKVKTQVKEDSKQNQEENSSQKPEESSIIVENKNNYLLTTINSNSSNIDQSEEDSSNDKETNSETEESEISSNNLNEPYETVSLNYVEEVSKVNQVSSSITSGYFTDQNEDTSTGVFLTNIKDTQIIGVLSNANISEIAKQISQTISELENNYEFVDLSDSEAIKTQYPVSNPHFSSAKNITLTGIDSLKAYLPVNNSKPETKIVWDENYVIPTGEKYQLVNSIEPLTQIATLEITSNGQSQSIPLYNTDKLTVRNWTDSFLKYGIITIIVVLILLIVWRLIYVHNRRKVLKRQRLRRLKRKRQLQARQIAMQRARNQSS